MRNDKAIYSNTVLKEVLYRLSLHTLRGEYTFYNDFSPFIEKIFCTNNNYTSQLIPIAFYLTDGTLVMMKIRKYIYDYKTHGYAIDIYSPIVDNPILITEENDMFSYVKKILNKVSKNEKNIDDKVINYKLIKDFVSPNTWRSKDTTEKDCKIIRDFFGEDVEIPQKVTWKWVNSGKKYLCEAYPIFYGIGKNIKKYIIHSVISGDVCIGNVLPNHNRPAIIDFYEIDIKKELMYHLDFDGNYVIPKYKLPNNSITINFKIDILNITGISFIRIKDKILILHDEVDFGSVKVSFTTEGIFYDYRPEMVFENFLEQTKVYYSELDESIVVIPRGYLFYCPHLVDV